MIHSISGTLVQKRDNFFVVDTGQIAFKLLASGGILSRLPALGEKIRVYSYLYFREDALELYGFLEEKELGLFEKLNSVSGIGPKSALAVMGVVQIDQLVMAINEGRIELLTRASGIGRKTAERIILDLKGKLSLTAAPQTLSLMESDLELEETLVALGYGRAQAKTALQNIDPKITGFKERLKEALRRTKK